MSRMIIFLVLFLSFSFNQRLHFNYNVDSEVEAFNSSKIIEKSYKSPYIGPNTKSINLFKSFSDKVVLAPSLSIKSSESAFEIDSKDINSPGFWLAPGYRLDYVRSIGMPFSGVFVHAWSYFDLNQILAPL